MVFLHRHREINVHNETAMRLQAEANCAHSWRVGWQHSDCVASMMRGAATLANRSDSCPADERDTFSFTSYGWQGPATAAMQCRMDGRYKTPGSWHAQVSMRQGAFNRSSALGVDREQCASFKFGREKVGKQKKLVHAGPAIVGADMDVFRALVQTRDGVPLGAGRFSLMSLSMNYSKRHMAGQWTPCVNQAFIMCALRGWLPKQNGSWFHFATRGRSLMSRCRACANKCNPALYWDECYILRAEYCMIARYCANGDQIWDKRGRWQCVPRTLPS